MYLFIYLFLYRMCNYILTTLNCGLVLWVTMGSYIGGHVYAGNILDESEGVLVI